MRKYYFQTASLFLLVLSIIAFSDNLITDVGQKSNSDPKFIIHGLIMFAWFIIFAIQANFIRKGNYAAHIKWGIAGMITAIGVFLSTVYVFVAVYKGWESMPFFCKGQPPVYAEFCRFGGICLFKPSKWNTTQTTYLYGYFVDS
jgi:hypothetical protein